jgi:hypothetical protein
MVEYVQYPPTMPHDFVLYSSNQEQHLEFHPNQHFIPSSTYAMDQTFSASYDHTAPLAEVPRPQDLQFHYDAIAQGVRPYQYNTPTGSPHSTSHSFHELPPVLSASSESGNSVSSSAMGSPSLVPQFSDSWNPMGLGLTSGYEYPAMIATEKSFVGKSAIPSTTASSSSSVTSPISPFENKHVFRTPTVPASANWSSLSSKERRHSLLSNEVNVRDLPAVTSSSVTSVPQFPQFSQSCRLPSNGADYKN